MDLFYLCYYLSIPPLQNCHLLPMTSGVHQTQLTLLIYFCDWSMRLLCFYLPNYKISLVMFQQRCSQEAPLSSSLGAYQHEEVRYLQGLCFMDNH